MSWLGPDDTVLVLSGIANPNPLVRYLKGFKATIKVKVFPDHHNFNRKDLDAITKRFNELEGKQKIIVTTEKDAVRLINNPYFPHQLKTLYFLPAGRRDIRPDECRFIRPRTTENVAEKYPLTTRYKQKQT